MADVNVDYKSYYHSRIHFWSVFDNFNAELSPEHFYNASLDSAVKSDTLLNAH